MTYNCTIENLESYFLQIDALLDIKHQQLEKSKKLASTTANLRRDIQKMYFP